MDEIISRATKPRNRRVLELMARGGMRSGEVLKLKLKGLQELKRILRDPQSGHAHKLVFIPRKVGDRLREGALEVQASG